MRGKFNLDSNSIIQDLPVPSSTVHLLLDNWSVSSGTKQFSFEVQDDANSANTWLFDINMTATGYNSFSVWYPIISTNGQPTGPPYMQEAGGGGGGGGSSSATACYNNSSITVASSLNLLTILAPANCRYRNTTISKPNTFVVGNFTISDINITIE